MKYVCTDYLQDVFELKSFVPIIRALKKEIVAFKRKHHVDSIVFTGQSGAAMAYPLSYLLRIPVICVRKGENRHSNKNIEGAFTKNMKYIIVDDFIKSGKTIDNLVDSIDQFFIDHSGLADPLGKPRLVGIFLYTQQNMYKIHERLPNIPSKVDIISVGQFSYYANK